MTDETAPWGRVDETGTVYVREAAGERVVGQYPDGTPEEALAYFRGARELALASSKRFRSNLHAIEAGYGLSLAQAGRPVEALAAYERSVAAIPDASRCASPLTLDAERDRQHLLAMAKTR